MAFVRVCSGRFERGMVLTHAATGRPFATKYAQSMFGQDRETVEEAFPGDVIGLVNATALRPGDTLYAGEVPVEFPPIPSFAPEHFAVVRGKDAGKAKQFRRGIEQLDTEGVIQVLASDLRGDQAPVLAAVGRCSSTWCCTGSSTSSAPGPSSTTWTTAWPGAPTPRAPACWRASARRRC